MKRIACLAALSLVCVAAACSSAPDGGAGNAQQGTATLHAGTTVISSDLANVAQVFADRVVFPASAWADLSSHKSGDILISDRQSPGTSGHNPEGFLRKVRSVVQTVEGTVVNTSAARLQEAVDKLQFQATLQTPKLTKTGPVTKAAGVHTLTGGSTTINLLDFSGTKLVDYTGQATLPNNQTIGFNAFATVETGTLDFSPSFDVGADIGFFTLNSFHATATGQLDATLLVDAGVNLQTTLDSASFTTLVAQQLLKAQSTRIADYDVDLGSISVGPFSMPSSAHFTADLGCDFAWGGGPEVKIGGTASGSVTIGLKYENGSMSPVFDHSTSFTQTGPDYTMDGVVRALCTITPQFQLKLFGVASGELTATAYAGVDGILTCGGVDANGNPQGLIHGDAEAGLSAKVHAKVDIFGLFKWEKECLLFDDNTMAQYDHAFTLPGGTNATCTPASNYKMGPPEVANPVSCFGGTDNGDGGAPPDPTIDAGSPTDDGAVDGGTGDGGADAPVDDGAADASDSGLISGSCTHDVCTAGERLGQQCDSCTMIICANDPYCCDTYWGLSCFQDVQTYCGKTCP